jgi:hypothetical protein
MDSPVGTVTTYGPGGRGVGVRVPNGYRNGALSLGKSGRGVKLTNKCRDQEYADL